MQLLYRHSANRISSLFVTQLERSLSLANVLLTCLDHSVESGDLDPISYNILLKTPRLSRLEAIIQAWTCCRYSEIDYVDLNAMISGKRLCVYQPKNKGNRYVDPFPFFDIIPNHYLDVNYRVRYISYDSYQRSIARCVPEHVGSVLSACNDKTHIFRHLRASYFYSIGFNISDISTFFGHKSRDATIRYIHDDLFP